MRTWTNPCRLRMLLIGIILCLLIANGCNAESTCKKGCPRSDNGLLKYIPGNVYEYNYDSLMTIGVSSGNDADETTLKIAGHAKLFAEGNCGYTLQLERISVSAVKESLEKQITQSITKPVHFTMVSGELEPDICTDPTDSVYALNIKRAVISMLQVGIDKAYETDVFGVCPTLSSITKSGGGGDSGSEIITKVRNLNACAYREQIANGLVNGVVNERAGIKSRALLMADYSKELKLNRGLIEQTQLVEEYKSAAISKGEPGVRAKVKTAMKLVNAAGKEGIAPQVSADGGNSVTIIFERPDTHAIKNINALKKVFAQTAALVNDHVQGDASQHFTELIRLMRSADADTLTELSAVPYQNKVLGRSVYLDALFRVGTSESIKAIVRQIPKMSDKEKKLAFTSMYLVQTVNRETLNQAASLLNGNSPKEAFLAIGNLVDKYCKHGTCNQADVNVVSKKFVDSLRHCKANTKRDEDRIVYVLKGIRNTHKIADASAAALIECASVAHSARIRVAAIQAFAATSCDQGLQQKAIALLRDRNEDSEIRIEAYLAAISCPNAQIASEIADIVNSETVYQVGGFITSNLKAIRDSTDPTREAARYYLSNIRVMKKFPIDPRRYSFNNELSYGIEALGMGASADYNLIYSQHGFLPRSGRLNLTSEMFGTNFNILEMSMRQENMENILEYYFGPKGLMRKEPQEILNVITSSGGGGADGGERTKRSIADDTSKFGKKYKTYGSKNINDMNFDFSMRFFGSEMFFLSLGDSIPSSVDEILKLFSNAIDKTKNQLKNYHHEYTMHSLFMDTGLVYPTGVGLPFEVVAQGFAATKTDVTAEIDIDAAVSAEDQKYRLKIVPSFDVHMNLQLRFNALVLTSGLRIAGNMHSAIGSDVTFKMLHGMTAFDIDIELPREHLNLIDLKVSTDFMISEQDKESHAIPLKSTKKRKNSPQENCFDQLQLFGFTVCYTAVLPDTPAALNGLSGSGNGAASAAAAAASTDGESIIGDLSLAGPFTLSVTLQSEKKFNIKVKSQQQKGGLDQIKLLYSTPSSKESHNTELTFDIGTAKPKIFARVAFDHPQKHLAIEGGIRNDDREFILYEQHEIDADITMHKIGFNKLNGNQYKPIIEVVEPGGVTKNDINGYHADGMITIKKDGSKTQYNFENFQLLNKDNERIVVNGWVDVSPVGFKTELVILPGKLSYAVKSHLNVDPNNGHSIGLFVNNNKEPNNIYGGSAFLLMGDNHIKCELAGKAGEMTIQIENDIEYKKNDKSRFKNSFEIKNKGNNIALACKLDGEANTNKYLNIDAEIVRLNKKASLAMKLNRDQQQGGYDLDVLAKLNKHFVDVKSKCEAKGAHYALDNTLATSWGTILTLQGEIGQRLYVQDVYVDLHGTLMLAANDKKSKWQMKLINQNDKMTTDFKLSRDNVDLIVFNGEMQHPVDKAYTGKMMFDVNTALNAKFDFKFNKNGKGDLVGVVNLKKAERKISFESKFTILQPKYDLDTTITFDNSKKITIKTENIFEKSKFTTKNAIEIGDQKVLFDVNGIAKGEWRMNGEVDSHFILQIPSSRRIEGQINRKMTTNSKTGLAHGTFNLQLDEQSPNGGAKRSLVFNSKLDKLQMKNKEFNYESHIVCTNFDGKKSDVKMLMKHLPKGQFKMIEFNLDTSGDLLNIPTNINLIIDEYDQHHVIGHGQIKVSDLINGKMSGNYHLKGRGQPSTYEMDVNLNVPKMEFKTFTLQTSGKYLKPETEDAVQMAELHIDQKTGSNGEQSIQLNGMVKGSRTHGSYNWDLKTNQMENQLKVDGSYDRQIAETNDKADAATTASSVIPPNKQKYTFNYNYGPEKFIKNTININYLGTESSSMNYALESSFESIKIFDFSVQLQKFDDNYKLNSMVKHNDKECNLDTILYVGDYKKGVEVKANLPRAATPIIVIGVFELLGERKAKLFMEIANLGDLDIKHNSEASFKTMEDFYLIAKLNSIKLKIDQLDIDVHSQNNKGVQFMVKNAKAQILSGTATYAIKKEKNKSILEGQGQVQYYDKSTNANFKLTRQIYDKINDNEIGFSYTFNGNFGPKNAVSTLKMTNKNFHAKLSICEEKKQCTNIEIRSIVSVNGNDFSIVQHDLMILIDLRELGYPHEFELQSKSSRHGFKFQYELESNIISNSNMKYQLIANVLPQHSKIQLKLPSREILLETEQKMPENGQIFGHYANSMTFFIDKVNKPNDVTRMVASADISGVERIAINIKGGLKFEHPSIRTLSISGQLDANREKQTLYNEIVFDIFRVPEQKVIATSKVQNDPATANGGAGGFGFNTTIENQIKSSGLGFQYTLNGHFALNPQKQEFTTGASVLSGAANEIQLNAFVQSNKNGFDFIFDGLHGQILNVKAVIDRKNLAVKFDSTMQILGTTPITILTEIQPSQAKVTFKNGDLVSANSEIKLGKEAKFDVVGNGGSKPLFNGRVAFDAAHFLSMDYESNDKNIEEFMKLVENDVTENTKNARDTIQKRYKKMKESIERQVELIKDSTPDFSQLSASYQTNVNEILKELENDPALKQFIEHYRHFYETMAKFVSDLAKLFSNVYEKLHKTTSVLYEKFLTTFNEVILPAMEEFSNKMIDIIGKMRIEIIRLSKSMMEQILLAYKQIEPELKALTKPITELFKPLNEAIDELIKALSVEFDELYNDIKEYIAKLPTFDAISNEIKQKLTKLKAVDEVLKFLRDIIDQMQQLPITPESQQFVTKLYDYIEAKLKGKTINDIEVLEDLYTSLMNAIRSLWQNFNEINKSITGGLAGDADAYGVAAANRIGYLSIVPFSLDVFSKIPAWISFKFSLLNFLYNEKLTGLTESNIFSLLKPPYDFLPPYNLKGHIADGQYMFTFDGQLIIFPGSCKYILAQDSVDNNFTVVANLKDAKMKSITLIDDSHFAEINDAGQLKIDGKATEYPVHINDMHVWRNYYTIWMRTQYGVEIICSVDLKICHIRVDGFYTSKTRGLLGNGNGEPNDDFTNVDGTIADNYATFGNGYSIGGNCQPVTAAAQDKQNIESNEICSELFGMDSSLLFGYVLIDSMPYRKACDNAVVGQKSPTDEMTACNIAIAYASAARLEHLPIHIPSRCIKCTGGSGQQSQRDYDTEFNIKTPTNKADVIFVVDIGSNKMVIDDLVTPAISELRQQLKTRGFTDVEIAVIAYNQQQLYPSLLTSNGGKLNYQGQFNTMIPNGVPSKDDPLDVGIDKVNQFIKLMTNLYDRMVTQSDELAFRMAVQYPFRAGAAKTMIGIRSDQLEYGNMLKFVRAHFGINSFDGVIVHLIAPVKDLSLEGVPPEKIIGFNSRIVATTDGKDAKKRPKLQYANDMGVDFVLNNGGWIFAVQNFQQLKEKSEQEMFVNQVTSSISDTLFKTEMISDCKCVAAYGLHGQNKCTVKSTTFQLNKRPKGSK